MQLLSFDEDSFDMDAHKKAAEAKAFALARQKRLRRRVEVYKALIMLAAAALFFLIYYLINKAIVNYDSVKYRGAAELIIKHASSALINRAP